MKILVIQQKMIGDVLTSSILFEVLRKEYPEAQLHYLIYRHTLPVVEHNPYIDEYILSGADDNSPGNFFALLRRIKAEKYDVIIDVYSKIGTAMLCAYSGAGITVSYEKWYTRNLYTHVVKRAKKAMTPAGLAIENRLGLLIPLIANAPAHMKPKLYLTREEIAVAGKRLEQAGISRDRMLLMVSVLGSSVEKTYPAHYLADLLDKTVAGTGAQLLFNYIPNQLPEVQKLYKICKKETRAHIHLDIFGKSLREFMALTSHCDALIGNEGGAVNMAKALNIPTFSIFSPAVEKGDWSLYEDGITNISVHLKDYKPEVFQDRSPRSIKKDHRTLYELFKPELIWDRLQDFLKGITIEKNR